MTPEGSRLRDLVLTWPTRNGLRTSDLLDVEPVLRTALLAVVRAGHISTRDLAESLALPLEDAGAIGAACAERGLVDRDGDADPLSDPAAPEAVWVARRAAPVRPRAPARVWSDLLDGLGTE